MTLFPYKICNFFKLSLENTTAYTNSDFNKRPNDYCQILISPYSQPFYELSYRWYLSDSDWTTEMTLFPWKCAIFFKLFVEKKTASTEPDLHQRHKDYCQILISHYSPPLYQLSYQWNLSYKHASTEMKLLSYKICYFFKLLAENSSAWTELDLNQRSKHFFQILISHYSPPLYQLSYQWNLSSEDPTTEMKLLPF